MSKTAKPAASQATDTPPPKKSKKKLIMIIAAVALLAGGGAAAFLLLKPAPAPKTDAVAEEAPPEAPPAYVQLGTFTANLIHEEGDRYLQVAIDLKITKPELAEKIKATNPEILHRVNMLLQSKRPSELASFDGKQKLAEQIKAQVEYVLGLRKTPPPSQTLMQRPTKKNPQLNRHQMPRQPKHLPARAVLPTCYLPHSLFNSRK